MGAETHSCLGYSKLMMTECEQDINNTTKAHNTAEERMEGMSQLKDLCLRHRLRHCKCDLEIIVLAL